MPYTYPKALVAGTNQNVNDLNTNLSGAAADWENAFSTYKDIHRFSGNASSSIFGSNGACAIGWNSIAQVGSSPVLGSVFGPLVLNPADRTAATRSTKYRVTAVCATNQIAPAITMTVGLYPIGSISYGTSGNPSTGNLGAVVTGSTVAFATPAASTKTSGASTDFTAPVNGDYFLAINISGAVPAGCYVSFWGALQYRQV